MKQVSFEELWKQSGTKSYAEFAEWLSGQVDGGRYKGVKASGPNGRTPSLYRRYWVADGQVSYEEWKEELQYRIVPECSTRYYMKHPDVYADDREWVLMLNDYLLHHRDALKEEVSVNERSFAIFGREKFLKSGGGRTILKRLSFPFEQLNVYETAEPISYYAYHKKTPQTILILENQDPFYSMRKKLLTGGQTILGIEAGTLIYGGGHAVTKAFAEFENVVEPYLLDRGNTFLYFGDLDHEGIQIYERLHTQMEGRINVGPFTRAYDAMFKKAVLLFGDEIYTRLPAMKEGQRREDGTHFFSSFSDDIKEKMKAVLDAGRYIPQEILDITDL